MNEDEKIWLRTEEGQEYFIYKTEKCDMQKELTETINKLQNNWNKLKNGLKSLFEFDEGVVSKDYLECAEDTLEKMQELEQGER